jgi:hypothetical protein
MTGFFSKDFILESAYGQYYFSSIAVYFIAVVGAIFTTLYSVKVLFLTFLTNPNGPSIYYKHAHESDIFISLPLVILGLFSIYFGFLTKDIFIGIGSNFFTDNSIFIHPNHEIFLDTEFAVLTLFKLLPLIFTVFFTVISIIYSEYLSNIVNNFKISNIGYYIFGFFNQRFLIEFIYNKYIVNLILELGGQTTRILDKGSVEKLSSFGLEKLLIIFSKLVSTLNKGVVTNYALYIVLSITLYVFIFKYNMLYLNTHISLFYIFSFLALLTISSILFFKNITLDSHTIQSNLLSYKFFNNLLKNSFIKLLKSLVMFLALFLISGELSYNTGTDSDTDPETSHIDKGKQKENIDLKNPTSEEDKIDPKDKTLEKENSETKGKTYAKREGNSYLNERFSRIHQLMIEHTEDLNKRLESELKKEDIHLKEDNELTKEELEKKEDLLNKRSKNVD